VKTEGSSGSRAAVALDDTGDVLPPSLASWAEAGYRRLQSPSLEVGERRGTDRG
jgi:hypothetical protein